MAYGLPNYSFIDRSGVARRALSDIRGFGPFGTLVHSTNGINSLGWLTGGSADAGTPASANYLIGRDGTTHKLCPFNRYPYHAGKSRYFFAGKWLRNNEVSQWFVGIELEATADQGPTDDQYKSLVVRVLDLARQLSWRWPLTILGHYAVAMPFGRRTDPWLFDWGLFGAYLVRAAQTIPLAGMRDHE